MHFFLLGPTGRTRSHFVPDLLSRDHTAVALVRTAGSLTPRSGLIVVTGSPLFQDGIRGVLFAASPLTPSVAIVILDTARKLDSLFAAQPSPPRFLADSCAKVCEVLELVGTRRVVVMSTPDLGDSWDELPGLSKAFMDWSNYLWHCQNASISRNSSGTCIKEGLKWEMWIARYGFDLHFRRNFSASTDF